MYNLLSTLIFNFTILDGSDESTMQTFQYSAIPNSCFLFQPNISLIWNAFT